MNRVERELYSICKPSGIILNYPSLKAQENRVNLHYYHAELAGGNTKLETEKFVNLGDFLSKVVVDFMLEKRGLKLDSCVYSTKHLYAIGCILLMGYQDATIWGSSFPFEPGRLRSYLQRFRNLDVRCVRGPKTRQTLLRMGFECPEIYGDPAALMPMIYQPKLTDKKKPYLVIPHYSMVDKLNKKYKDCVVSMATDDYKSVIDSICSAEYVISSSLHGIILAETYGIPAVFYMDRPQRFNYKYEDWYLATDRKLVAYNSVEEAIETHPKEKPDLNNMRENLVNSFPYDLWTRD